MLFIRYDGELKDITDVKIIDEFKFDVNYAHATQIIWATTNKLGCAFNKECGVSRLFGYTSA